MSDKFYKNLRIIFLILAILCMGLSLLRKAKAADYSVSDFSDYINDIYDIAGSNKTSYTDSFINDAINNSVSFVQLYNDNENVLIFSNQDFLSCYYAYDMSFDQINHTINSYIGKYPLSYSGAWYTEFYAKKPVPALSDCLVYYIYISSSELICSKVIYRSSSYFQDLSNSPSYMLSFYNLKYTLNNNDGSFSELGLSNTSNNRMIGYKAFGNNCFGKYNGSFYAYDLSEYFTDDMINAPDVNTEGFEVYKYGSDDNTRLVCDFSDCISISPAVSNSSTISLTINIDGIDNTFNFNSSSTYYSYSVSSGSARYSFPLSVLGITSNTINARLNSVSIVNTTSSPGGSDTKNIIWVTPISLVGSNYNDVSKDDIPFENLPDYDNIDDPLVQQQYKEITNRWLTTYYNSFPLSLFQRWNFEPKYIIQGVLPYNSSQAVKDALESALRNIGNLDFGNAVADALTIGQGMTLQEQISTYLYDNFYLTDLYDIICFAYQVDENNTRYYVYTTDSYNNHLSNSLTYDILQAIYDDGKALDVLYNYLYDRLDDFEDKSLTKLNELVGLSEINNNLFSGFIDSLNNKLDDILNALLNLDLEVPVADYSSITSRLDTIINHESEGFNSYQEWVKQLQDNASGNGIYKWVNGTIDSMKSAFSFFNLEDLDNNIAGDQTYIYYTNRYFEYLTQDTFFNRLYSGSLNIYDFNGGY